MPEASDAHDQLQSPQSDEMKVDPSRAKELVENLTKITSRIASVSKGRHVRLLAVSKLKPASDVLALHDPSASQLSQPPTPHLHFGENYAQELAHKAAILPRSIRWHFIGGLQTNKCKDLAKIPNLWSVESVDSIKKADALQKGRKAFLDSEAADGRGQQDEEGSRLGIHIQINTSGESNKSGVEPGSDATALCRHVLTQCPQLRLRGLMTIGAIARSVAPSGGGANEDFECLKQTREQVLRDLKAGAEGQEGLGNDVDLELSMGMSADFEDAIRQGSAEVRVGSQIFGERPSKEDAKAKADADSG
ncbi:MAG: hypothetical protein M4579_005593 [Chaenotheca gracillima]|nr:MAG: hypothetical protein M4579_005593 [Chaenotheca gracillima]